MAVLIGYVVREKIFRDYFANTSIHERYFTEIIERGLLLQGLDMKFFVLSHKNRDSLMLVVYKGDSLPPTISETVEKLWSPHFQKLKEDLQLINLKVYRYFYQPFQFITQ